MVDAQPLGRTGQALGVGDRLDQSEIVPGQALERVGHDDPRRGTQTAAPRGRHASRRRARASGRRERLVGRTAIGAIADQGLGQGRQRQERRIFPAAIGGGEHPAVRRVDDQGTQQDRQQRQRDQAAVEADQDRDAAEQLGQNDRPGQAAGRPTLPRKPAKPGTVNTASLR